MLSLTVPLTDSADDNSILEKFPIIKLKVFDLNSNKSSTIFKLEKNYSFLRLDGLTGKLWFLRKNFGFEADKSAKVIDDIVITAENRYKNSARVSITLTVKSYENLNEFCMSEDFCFYNRITHHIVENDSDDIAVPRDVGDLSPKIFSRICKSFNVSYRQLNGKGNDFKSKNISINLN